VWQDNMFAVIRTGGKQYKVATGDIIDVERLAVAAGGEVRFGDVLAVGGGSAALKIGQPLVAGATVLGEVVAEKRGPKILVFKKKRRKNYRRKIGHRQTMTTVKITQIAAG
jgi:large subunit ribosomal protein L21